MFGKKTSNALLDQSGRSFVGESMQIEGDIDCSGAVDVAGLINGNVHVQEMIIFDTGSVKGNINVKNIEINGHIEGQVNADRISLGNKSVIKGDITFHTSLITKEGAEIDGYIKGKSVRNPRNEEDNDIEEIMARPELGKPKLVKDDKKEAI
jgi:cytoskeletal protein CcmA (bactofilin family)